MEGGEAIVARIKVPQFWPRAVEWTAQIWLIEQTHGVTLSVLDKREDESIFIEKEWIIK